MEVSINLDGTGVCSSHSQIPFLDHMMDVSFSLSPAEIGTQPCLHALRSHLEEIYKWIYRTVC